jgi:hypothetical protein
LLVHVSTAPEFSVSVAASLASHQLARPEMLAGLNPLALGRRSLGFIGMV